MDGKECRCSVASVLTSIESPQRSHSHIRLRRIRGRLARRGVEEQDWEPFNESANQCGNV